ncbi:MAG: HlyC/CorC family transporter [Phycisphaerales bacterium]|nr:MAG: HlyC/CorC family transporter [Phycisphaerales bacterium]
MLWIALALLLVCSGIVSASETALFALSRQMLYRFGRSPGPLRRRVYLLMQQPRQVLMTVLMTNTAINVAIFALSFFALRHIGEASAAVAAAGSVMVPLAVVVFGEMLPKAIALSGSQRFAPPASGLIGILQVVLRPIQWILSRLLVEPVTRLLAPRSPVTDAVTMEELRLLVDHSAREGVIDSTESEMLQATVALGEVSVREVMTPRVDIRSIQIDGDRAAILRMIRESGRRRLPVYGRDLDDIRGVLHARDLYLDPEAPLKGLIRRVRFVPEQANLMQLLRHFRTENMHLAVVVDEYGGTAGLVTTEDIVGSIVGELPDAETPRPAITTERLDENTYRLSGDLSARVWADRFGAGEIDRNIDTVAGLILARLGRLPRTGDSIRIRNLTLTVETMRRRRIERVLLRRRADVAVQAEDPS